MERTINKPFIPFFVDRLRPASSRTELADRYCRHEFNLLGSGWIKLRYGMLAPGFEGRDYSDPLVTWESVRLALPEEARERASRLMDLARRIVPDYEPIDWMVDMKSGYRYPLVHFRQIAYGRVDGVDAKLPYDLSRHYQAASLALAYRATGLPVYKREFMAQLLDWMAMNPYEYGIGWHYAMNVGIRAVNWLAALSLVQDDRWGADEPERLFMAEFDACMRDHRRFIAANLEFPEIDIHPNHYLANLSGLLLSSLYLEESDADSAAWTTMAIREIGLELDRQFGADGFQFESTTAYHAFAMEMLIVPLLMAAAAEGSRGPDAARTWLAARLGDARLAKWKRMFGTLAAITQPDGTIPLIGDADSGRMLYLDEPGRESRNWTFLGVIGAALFGDPTLLPSGARQSDGAAAELLLGEAPDAINGTAIAASRAFPDAGFYVMRDENVHSVIFCGPIGTGGSGGHAHDDKLSFTLALDGLEFLVDPGVYVYTANQAYRAADRSVLHHNTVCVGQASQNRQADSVWWGYKDDTRCRVMAWDAGPDRVRFVGEHSGYTRLPIPVRHRRTIEWEKAERRIAVTDRFPKEADVPDWPSMRFTFNLHPDCQVELTDAGAVVAKRGGIELRIRIERGRWTLEEGYFCPAYGVKQRAVRLVAFVPNGVDENRIELDWQR